MAITISGTDGITPLKATNGTAAAPSVTGADTDTGLFFGTNEVNIATAGTARVKVDSSGDLEVQKSSTPVIRLNQNDTFFAPIKLAGNDLEIRGSSGQIEFYTGAADGESSTERMRISDAGSVRIGKTGSLLADAGHVFDANGTTNHTRSGGAVVSINRTSNDGTLIDFYQDTSVEGNITVSGSTVSYNGAHLTRWSQLAGGAERIEILRGSVLSNLDEMCEWGEEDNEQLNRMKISNVEGDVNVAGVFQAWDDDDDTYTNDFYCAMTGDFIIRIAQGTTVARGDLLMSAGDGTAKPQDDDIVRSKTVAKVTSTTVSTTYADGSYCVPCVLMAC